MRRSVLLLFACAFVTVAVPGAALAVPPDTCVPVPGTAWVDCDGDGFATAQGDCDDGQKSVFPGAAELCNGQDDDCDSQTDEDLAAPAGTCLEQGVCAGAASDGGPVAKCAGAKGFVCDYPFGYEPVAETLCDNHDNDCDGQTDEGLRNACGQCGPSLAEACNGQDDDCNGLTDEDLSLPASACQGPGVCAGATAACQYGKPACVFPLAWEATETRCDGADNDCDGQTDEELGLGQTCHVGKGACLGQGSWTCGTGDAVVCSAVERQPSKELCGDGVDNDCNGTTDEGYEVGSQCAVGEGACRVVGKSVCSTDRTSTACKAVPLPPGSEQCANLIDDDCDGQTDEPDCKRDPIIDDLTCSAGPTGSQPGLLVLLAATALLLWRRSRAARPAPVR